MMGSPTTRRLVVAILVASVAAVALVVRGVADSDYELRLEFESAGQLVTGGEVQVGGRRVGTIRRIGLTRNATAEVTIAVTDVEHHRNIRCAGLGFKSLVKKATTASLGIAKERTPGQKAAMVYLMTFCLSSRLRVSKCRPLPDAAAALEMPKLTKAQICWSRQ